jgi:hypothetical protein
MGLQERLDRATTWRFTVSAHCVEVPADDAALLDWLGKNAPDLKELAVKREPVTKPRTQGEKQYVDVSYSGPADAKRLEVPWKELGYQLGQPDPTVWWFRMAPELRYTPADPQLQLIVMNSLMAGLFTVGIVRMWRNRRRDAGEQLADAPGLLAGAGVGFGLAALYWLYHQAALHWGGATVGMSPCWQSLPISGVDINSSVVPDFWRGVQPHPFLLLMIVTSTILFPVAQMVFIWGVFRRWTHGGWVKTGCVLAAAVTASLTMAWYYLPVLFVSVLVLVWFGNRAGSMGWPLTALIVWCTLVVGMAFGAVPSLTHPVNQLPGKWERVVVPVNLVIGLALNTPEEEPLVFLHGGGAESGDMDIQVDRILTSRSAWHYEWVGDDTIELVWRLEVQDHNTKTFTTVWVRENYRVEVSWQELTLTPVGEGQAMKFRRMR